MPSSRGRIEPISLTSSALADRFFITSTTWEAPSESTWDVTQSREKCRARREESLGQSPKELRHIQVGDGAGASKENARGKKEARA